MSGIAIQISLDSATPAVQSLRAGLAPDQVNPIIGRSARNTYRTHLFGIDGQRANKLGGARTNFYASAARATQFRVQGDLVIVSINQVGIGLRYFGGTVRPKVKKYLTIPAVAEAHGKRASEFPELKFALVPDPKTGRLRAALVRRGANIVSLISTRRAGGRTITSRREAGAYVMFWLVKQATFQPDPSVLPYPELVEAEAARAVDAYAKLLWERRNPSPAGGDN